MTDAVRTSQSGGALGSDRAAGSGRTLQSGPSSVKTALERVRCGWATSAPEYVAYHDDEWGVPVHGDDRLFERICLEAFQAGLSWLTILRKRPAFREAFAGFQIAAVADFDERDRERLMSDVRIVRNASKIDAAMTNAGLARQLDGGLDALLWSFAPGSAHQRPNQLSDVPAATIESTAMARELKKRGFRFVGPTTAYALMQATGMVDDHIASCWRAVKAGSDPLLV